MLKNIGNEYSWQGMLIVSILMIIGILILYFTGIVNISDYNGLYNYLSYHLFEVIMSMFFIFCGVYCWIMFVRNMVIRPKKEILYLVEIDNNVCCFLDRKGKKYYFPNNNYSIKNYYEVLKTYDSIKKIVGGTEMSFTVPKEKESYWLNFYCIMGNFENIFLLPIVYIFLLPGLLSFFMSKGIYKIFAIIFMIIPVYLIIYDLIYKIKKKRDGYVDDTKLVKSYVVLINSIELLTVLIINIILLILFFKLNDIISKLIISPFCLCAICAFGQVLSVVLGNYKMKQIFTNLYIVIFLIYWFSFIAFLTFNVIKYSYSMALFSIPFFAVGIFIIYRFFLKKK